MVEGKSVPNVEQVVEGQRRALEAIQVVRTRPPVLPGNFVLKELGKRRDEITRLICLDDIIGCHVATRMR